MGQKEIIVVDYNDEWKIHFEELKTIFSSQLKDIAQSIEHVGSTSIHGLAAKPILDIDIVIDSRTLLPEVIESLKELGYIHEGDLGVEGREAFTRTDNFVPFTEVRKMKMEHHLYVCDKENEELKRHITFRNILRKHPHLVDEYARLKNQLAKEYRNNRQAYTNGKTSFVNSVLSTY